MMNTEDFDRYVVHALLKNGDFTANIIKRSISKRVYYLRGEVFWNEDNFHACEIKIYLIDGRFTICRWVLWKIGGVRDQTRIASQPTDTTLNFNLFLYGMFDAIKSNVTNDD